MPAHEKKLSDVFNAYADKVVQGRELEALFREAVENHLTARQLKEFSSLKAPVGAPDNSEGIYLSNSAVYFSGEWMKRNLPVDHVPDALAPRLAAALDEALSQAKDYSADVKSGKLQPLPPNVRFGF
jgi:hypothetical protein